MPTSVSKATTDSPLSPGPTVSIERPRAVAKFSLLDAQPGQLLPPPSGKYSGWTPTKPERKGSYSGESDEDTDEDSDEDEDKDSRPMSPGQAMPVPVPMPPVPEDSTPESPPTPPASPQPGSPVPPAVLPDPEQVTRRLSKKSSERPRSAGDLNEVKPLSPNDSSAGSTPTNSSIGSDGKKEPPPPPPPRNKKGHSRSSSLDLNKLFASKGKESRGEVNCLLLCASEFLVKQLVLLYLFCFSQYNWIAYLESVKPGKIDSLFSNSFSAVTLFS